VVAPLWRKDHSWVIALRIIQFGNHPVDAARRENLVGPQARACG
jgi:hypothetical protein